LICICYTYKRVKKYTRGGTLSFIFEVEVKMLEKVKDLIQPILLQNDVYLDDIE